MFKDALMSSCLYCYFYELFCELRSFVGKLESMFRRGTKGKLKPFHPSLEVISNYIRVLVFQLTLIMIKICLFFEWWGHFQNFATETAVQHSVILVIAIFFFFWLKTFNY